MAPLTASVARMRAASALGIGAATPISRKAESIAPLGQVALDNILPPRQPRQLSQSSAIVAIDKGVDAMIVWDRLLENRNKTLSLIRLPHSSYFVPRLPLKRLRVTIPIIND
jgi:hypothetical protein